MASYKKLYEAAMEECRTLQAKIDELNKFDSLLGQLTNNDEREFAMMFMDRCQNRAEAAIMVRILNRLGA